MKRVSERIAVTCTTDGCEAQIETTSINPAQFCKDCKRIRNRASQKKTAEKKRREESLGKKRIVAPEIKLRLCPKCKKSKMRHFAGVIQECPLCDYTTE